MKRKITLLLMILAALAIESDPIAYADAGGFRGLQWGTKSTTVKDDMNYVRTDPSYGGEKIYTRKNDELKINGAEVQSIKYSFWMDKLSSVMIRFKGYSNFISLKNLIVKKFGKGHKIECNIKRYVWGGEVTAVALEYNDVFKEGYWFMFSTKTHNEQQRFVEKGGKETD